jgi:UrcA family protein
MVELVGRFSTIGPCADARRAEPAAARRVAEPDAAPSASLTDGDMTMRNPILAALALAGLSAAAAPALAQTVEQLTVTGQWNGRGEPPASLSRVVSYDDLDLRLVADQNELRHRIVVTAQQICDELGQDRPNRTNLGRSCQDVAVNNAMQQVRFAVAQSFSQPGPAYAVVAPTGQGANTAYEAPVGPSSSYDAAASADTAGAPASYTTQTVTNGPVPDTPTNRARFGGPMSNAGKHTAARGN